MLDTQKIFDYDLDIINKSNIKFLAGVDEVGRGPLAGPVVTCAIIMKYDKIIMGVFDSKRVSEKKRNVLYDEILKNCEAVSISMENEKVIDEINILNATKKSMTSSVENLSITPDLVLIDAIDDLKVKPKIRGIIKGDSTSYAIACASIIAKVTRDRLMETYDNLYPNYDFKANKGYGTKKHIEAIKKYGLCDIHRRSFTKNFTRTNC